MQRLKHLVPLAAPVLLAAGLLGGSPAHLTLAAGGGTIGCDTATPSASQPPHPGPLRWGINPRVQAGQIGLQQPAVASVPQRQLAALSALTGGTGSRAGSRPFVVRLNRVFFPPQPGQDAKLASDFAMYSGAGYAVEFQLRFHPPDLAPNVPDKFGGDPTAFAAWAAQVVHRYDADPALVSVQVVNEANVDYSFDSSDGYYSKAMAAMSQGVVAAKHQVILDGQPHVKIGTNWVYRGLPQTDKAFWDTFATNALARGALDWMGLDAYPGTFPFPNQPPSYGAALAADLDLVRRCFMPYAGIPGTVPIYIEETGWPTVDPLRPQSTQLNALRQLTAAAHDYAGTYNVTDFRWFNLRDADTSSPNFQQHFGLLASDYTRKPAFCAYRAVITGEPGCPADAPIAGAATPAATSSPPRGGLPLTSGGSPGQLRRVAVFLLVGCGALVLGALRAGQPQTLGQNLRRRR